MPEWDSTAKQIYKNWSTEVIDIDIDLFYVEYTYNK